MVAQSSPKHKQSPKKGTNSVQPFKTAFRRRFWVWEGWALGCLEPTSLSNPQELLAQVHVRTPPDAQGTFRGRSGSATGVAQTVRPQPDDATADSLSARLSHSPHRNVRGKRSPARRPSAGCLLCNPRVASTARTARPAAGTSGTNAAEVSPPHRGSGGAGESRGELFGADVAGDAPVHLAGPMRKRRPEAPFTSQKPRRCIHRADRRVLRSKMATVVRPKSSERAAPRAAAADKEPICHGPVRKSGIRVLLPTPCSFSKPGACPQTHGACPHAVSFRSVSCGDSVPLVEAILFRLHGGQ